MCVCGVSKWVNLRGSAEKFYKGKSKTNFPLTILIRMVEGFLQFVGSIHNSGWDIDQLGQQPIFYKRSKSENSTANSPHINTNYQDNHN